MLRVSSRQRLFSWDQFDATAECSSTSDEESDYITCLNASSRNTSFAVDNDDDDYDYYNDEDTIFDIKLLKANTSDNAGTQIFPRKLSYLSTVTPPGRTDTISRAIEKDTPLAIKRTNANGTMIKKSVSFSNLIIANKNEVVRGSINPSPRSSVNKCHHYTTAPNASPATTSNPPSSALTLLDLNCDTQIDLISFLTAEEVQCVGMTCHYFNDMLLVIKSSLSPQDQVSSVARNTIWWSFMRDRWPHLPLLLNGIHNEDAGDGTTNHTATTLPLTQIIFTDSRRTITTATVSQETINFGALLKQAPTEMPPSQIDSQFYVTSSSLSSSVSTTTQTPTLPSTQPPNTDPPLPSLEAVTAIRKQAFISYEMKTPFFSEQRLRSPRRNSDDNDDGDVQKLQRPHQQQERQEQTPELEEIVRAIQFIGTVGTGDRSIRADRPFPRPLESISAFKPLVPRYEHEDDDEIHSLANGNNNTSGKSINNENIQNNNTYVCFSNFGSKVASRRRKRKGRKTSSSSSTVVVTSPRRAFFEMLEKGRKCHARYLIAVAAATQALQAAQMRNGGGESSHSNATTTKAIMEKIRSIPFVSPFIISNPAVGGECDNHLKFAEIDMTPRMVAYFEVSILLRDKMQEPDMSEIGQSTTATTTPLAQPQQNRQHTSECVAVGLSAQSSKSRMPGWDKSSYGYHGDDGGIFHSRGEMVRVYGPKYGEGDTVGCGVNYENGGIFYTLNGNFLGYAWCSLEVVQEGKLDLYPTVGVDSNCPLVLNFGNARPFMFDLASFVASKGSVPTRSI